MEAERPEDSVQWRRVRDHAAAVTRARNALAAALAARDRACAAAHDEGLSWTDVASAADVSLSTVRRAISHGLDTAAVRSPGEGIWLAIDTPGTRIREDAFRVRTLPDRNWMVEIASPAVTDIVALGGALDHDARERMSVTVRRGIRTGMLPRELESELSFAPGFCGPVLVVAITLDAVAQDTVRVDVRRDMIGEGAITALTDDDGDHLLATCADRNPTYHALAAAHAFAQHRTRAGHRSVATRSIVAEIATAANVAATHWAHQRG